MSAPAGRRLLVALALLAGAGPLAGQPACPAPAEAETGAWPAPLARTVSLSARELSLRDALDRLSASAGVSLSYSPDLLPLDRRVCVAVRRVPLGAALTALLRGTGVEPVVVAGQVALVPGRSAAPRGGVPRGQWREAPPSVLEAIVVTGSPAGAARRGLTVAMDAVSGQRLAQRSASSLADALNRSAAGVWVWRQSPSALLSRFASVRGASSFGGTYPKVYVDGIELANPLLVGTLDPEAIERVEVIRGPQGAALYGSEAISGVINIVTRHGGTETGAPRPELVSRAGASASGFASAPLTTHEERLAIRTGSNLASGSLALTMGGSGEIYPGASSRTLGASGGGRWVMPSAIVSVSARVLDRRAGLGSNPLLGAAGGAPGDSLRQGLTHYSVSASATLSEDGRWTHTLLAGLDGYRLDQLDRPMTAAVSPLDTAARMSHDTGVRAMMRASSTVRLDDGGSRAAGSLTLAAEYSALRQLALTGDSPVRAGHALWRDDTGLLAQVSGSLDEAWFVTGGLRLERNDGLGNHDLALLPMLGAAWVHELGPAELKLRAAYGRGIRPAQSSPRGQVIDLAGELEPEAQAGTELGADLYLGGMLSISATRFDQRATGLIQDVAPGGTTARTAVLDRFQNVGAIGNRGWEAQAALSRGAVTLSGGFALVDSRVSRLAPGYLGDLRPGDRMLGVPARTASLAAEWRAREWSGSLSAERAWDWVDYDRLALARELAAGGDSPSGPALRGYWIGYAGSTELSATLWRRVSPGVWLTGAVENLLGNQLGEPDNASIRAGRTVTMGIRATF